ncbi:hypothetical protein WME89_27360 [Sorangium sp. So ce321]
MEGYLIRLGLANRKVPRRKAAATPAAPAASAGPVDQTSATALE